LINCKTFRDTYSKQHSKIVEVLYKIDFYSYSEKNTKLKKFAGVSFY